MGLVLFQGHAREFGRGGKLGDIVGHIVGHGVAPAAVSVSHIVGNAADFPFPICVVRKVLPL